MIDVLIKLIIGLAVLVIIWWVTERFSPDPLITRIVQVVLFILALLLVIKLLLPLVGVSI